MNKTVDGQANNPAAEKMQATFADAVVGSSFRWPTKAVAIGTTAIVVLFVAGLFVQRDSIHEQTLWLFAGAAAAMCAGCWHIANGQTRIDANGIHQDGMIWGKHYTWHELQRARFLKLPMATRLVINTGRPPFKAIYAGTPELESAFRKVADAYGNRVGI